MKKIFSIVIVTAMFASTTQADFKIKSVSKEKNMVSVDIGSDANVQPGNDMTVQWRDKECTLKVSKINGNVALADGRECEIMDKLKAGDAVTMSDFQHTGKYMETAPVSNPEVGRKKTTWEQDNEGDLKGFGAVLGFNTASDIKTKSGGSESTTDGSGALNIGVRYVTIPEYGFGFMAGLSYEMSRTFDGTPDAKLSLLPIELDGVFRNDKFFGFAGVNLPIVASNSGWGTSSPSGQLGIQLGVGVLAIPKLSFELYYQTLNFDVGGTDYARLWGAGLRAAYHF